MAGINLIIGTPMYGGMATANYIRSLLGLQRACDQIGIPFDHLFIWNDALVTRARNMIAAQFLSFTEGTHLLWCDADTGFNPDDIFKMLGADKDIIGAACPKKSLNWPRIQKLVRMDAEKTWTGNEMMSASGDLVVRFLKGQDRIGSVSDPMEVDVLGTGLLLVKREVFLKIDQKFPDRKFEGPVAIETGTPAFAGGVHDFFIARIDPETRDYLSEDVAFCKDARTAGCSVWLAPWVVTTHVGSFEFQGNIPAIVDKFGPQI